MGPTPSSTSGGFLSAPHLTGSGQALTDTKILRRPHLTCSGRLWTALNRLLLLRCAVDDPLDAFAVHGACGAWGVVACALFTTPQYARAVAGLEGGGLFYGDGRLLGAACLFLVAQVQRKALRPPTLEAPCLADPRVPCSVHPQSTE